MKREEDWLRQACEEAAREETQALERRLSRAQIRQAEETYQHHRRKALALIRERLGGRKWNAGLYFRAAAAVILIIGAVLFTLNQTSPETVPMAQLPSPDVAPYMTGAPVFLPSPTPTVFPIIATSAPNIGINPEASPTLIQNSTVNPTISPTLTPSVSETPASTPDASRQPSPSPTPEPAPTLLPETAPEPEPEKQAPPLQRTVPETWQGVYFPTLLPEGCRLQSCVREESAWTARYLCQGKELVFMEYDTDQLIPISENAAVSYVQWNGIVALRTENASGILLSWVQDSRSFTLAYPDECLEIAESVQKIE